MYDIPSRFFEGKRTCYLHEPASFPCTTLYLQDGEAFYHKLALHQTVDALVEQEEIQPVRLVFLEPQDRVKEYWFHHQYERFLLEEVMPFIDHQHDPTERRGLRGASL